MTSDSAPISPPVPEPAVAPPPVVPPSVDPRDAATPHVDPSVPSGSERVLAVGAEHPEYLILAALIGGLVLAKVVKKLAG